MIEKGFWSSSEYVSAWLIDHKFRQLLKNIERGYFNKSRGILFEYVQDCARKDLLEFLLACFNNEDLTKLSSDSTLHNFWDHMLSEPSARMLVRTFHPKNSEDQLRPQTSLKSFDLLMGYCCLRKAALCETRGDNTDNTRHLACLDKAISFGNFRAFVIRTGYLLRELKRACTTVKRVEDKTFSVLIPQLENLADKYGAAGFLVLNKIYFQLSNYQHTVLKDLGACFQYYLAAYGQLIKANSVLSQLTADLHNALLGDNLRTLMPRGAASLELAISNCRAALLEAQFPEDKLISTERTARKEAQIYIVRYYLDERMAIDNDKNLG